MNLLTFIQTISTCILISKLWSFAKPECEVCEEGWSFAKPECVCEEEWGQWSIIDE